MAKEKLKSKKMKHNFNLFVRFLLVSAGINQEISSKCKSQIHKFTTIGTAIVVTSVIAVLSGCMFISNYTDSPWIVIGGGFLWGTIIWILERLIVTFTKFGVFNWGTLPRIVMAVILAIVVTMPVMLITFSDSISKKLNNDLKLQITEITLKYDDDLAKIDNVLNNDFNVLLNKKQQLSQLDSMNIASFGSKQKTMNRSERKSSSLSFKQYSVTRANLEADIGKFEAIYNNLKQEKDEEKNIIRTLKQSDIDEVKNEKPQFVNKAVALFELAKTNYIVDWGIWLFHILFFCFELLPITIKLAAPKDTGKIYDEVALLHEGFDISSSTAKVLCDEMVLLCRHQYFIVINLLTQNSETENKISDFEEIYRNSVDKINNTIDENERLQYPRNLMKILKEIEIYLRKLLGGKSASMNNS